jgi:phosphoribosyl 1,2-cyclic phosphate phosphodiesterase
MKKIEGSKIMVLNALRKEKHLSHYTLQEAIDVVDALGVPNVYFTHISHQLGTHADINAELPIGKQLAFDGLVINC